MLWELVWAAPLAAIVVMVSFSGVVLGAARSAESRREDAGGAATAWGLLAVVAGLIFTGLVVLGVVVIVAK